MASEYNKQLQLIFAPIMKAAGYKKTAQTWHRYDQDFIRVFNIQGSQWGPSFYLNLGIYIKAIGNKERPCEYDCHVRSRVATDDLKELNDLLNFSIEMPYANRAERLAFIVQTIALPWLEHYASRDNIINGITAPKRQLWAVTADTWSYLGLSPHA